VGAGQPNQSQAALGYGGFEHVDQFLGDVKDNLGVNPDVYYGDGNAHGWTQTSTNSRSGTGHADYWTMPEGGQNEASGTTISNGQYGPDYYSDPGFHPPGNTAAAIGPDFKFQVSARAYSCTRSVFLANGLPRESAILAGFPAPAFYTLRG